MTLFTDENVILESDTKEVILTSHRISQKISGASTTRTKSIMLEHITSCHTYHKSSLIALLSGSLFIILAFLIGGTSEKFISTIIGVAFILYYFSSKRSEIQISSPSTTISMKVDKMPQKSVEHFIDKVENAKHTRMLAVTK